MDNNELKVYENKFSEIVDELIRVYSLDKKQDSTNSLKNDVFSQIKNSLQKSENALVKYRKIQEIPEYIKLVNNKNNCNDYLYSLFIHIYKSDYKTHLEWENIFKKYKDDIKFEWISDSHIFIYSKEPIVGLSMYIQLLEYDSYRKTIMPIIEYCPITMIEYIENHIYKNNDLKNEYDLLQKNYRSLKKKYNIEIGVLNNKLQSKYVDEQEKYKKVQQEYDDLNNSYNELFEEFKQYKRDNSLIIDLFNAYNKEKDKNEPINESLTASQKFYRNIEKLKEKHITRSLLQQNIDLAAEPDDLYGNSYHPDYIAPNEEKNINL